MSLKIYNTLGGKKEEFVPLQKGRVGMYVCGPTVYDTSHIGHARSVVVFDAVFRWLRKLGYDVCYVRNFTDVDDKIIKKAEETGERPEYITEKYIREFHREMDALNVLRPTIEPKATDHIDHIVSFIEKLVDRGKAYAVPGGDVYFAIDSFEGYGMLSGRDPGDMKAGSRVAVDGKKRNPLDFTLWKPAKPGEPAWDSPWGRGRPGWHIECSAMSYEYLGNSFDIHGGGKDLIFPHHENEITQSEALFGKRFVKYWMHNGFVDINNEKMSKSLGNFTMIKDVLSVYPAEVIRLFLLSKHYRSPIDYNEESMRETEAGLERVYTFLDRAAEAGVSFEDGAGKGNLWSRFESAMNDDFNTAKGLSVVFDAVKQGNRILDEHGTAPPREKIDELAGLCSGIREMGQILGVFLLEPGAYFSDKTDRAVQSKHLDTEEIDRLVAERTEARKNRDFARADAIRDQLAEMNIVLEDGPDGTVWKVE
ncbi:MAG: cysteine--tRNA ligase [Desulfobacteraceae bacterium]